MYQGYGSEILISVSKGYMADISENRYNVYVYDADTVRMDV